MKYKDEELEFKCINWIKYSSDVKVELYILECNFKLLRTVNLESYIRWFLKIKFGNATFHEKVENATFEKVFEMITF